MNPSGSGLVNEAKTGVGDGGHSRIGDHDDARARLRLLNDCRGLGGFIVVVEADEFRAEVDSHSRGQCEKTARVFCGDDVGLLERWGQTRRGIAYVTDGGCSKKNRGGGLNKILVFTHGPIVPPLGVLLQLGVGIGRLNW